MVVAKPKNQIESWRMIYAANQAWLPNLPDGPPLSTIESGDVLTGVGAPNDSDGSNGDIYVNITNGDSYTKSGDTWNIAGGGGGTNNKNGAGTPVGTATPDYVGQTYIDTNTPHFFWVSTGLTNADWVEVAGNLP